jgi:hypothetical protein
LSLDQDFSVEIVSCIEAGLSKFGNSMPQVVFWNFERQTNLNRRDIFRRPDLFSESIRKIFSGGSLTIEKKLVEEIVANFHLPVRNYSGLVDVVNEMKSRKILEFSV